MAMRSIRPSTWPRRHVRLRDGLRHRDLLPAPARSGDRSTTATGDYWGYHGGYYPYGPYYGYNGDHYYNTGYENVYGHYGNTTYNGYHDYGYNPYTGTSGETSTYDTYSKTRN